MKTYRQREKQGSKVQESTKGPDEAKIKVTCRKHWLFCTTCMQTEVVLMLPAWEASVLLGKEHPHMALKECMQDKRLKRENACLRCRCPWLHDCQNAWT